MIVIVHGPQGCGKFRYAKLIASHFHLNRILENWDPATGLPGDCFLALTNDKHRAKLASRRYKGVVSLSFKQARTLVARPLATMRVAKSP